ncbi:hypothetical protein B0H13DRAFT_2056102 [Mycena leptocephala]|nr:hypothetical protein B0H13DRAFT_2056102 [Mycena leptocephala]
MVLASTDLLLITPLGIWVLWVNVRVVGLSPWIFWDDTHSNFSRMVQVPGIYWRADPYSVASVEMLRWAVACALLFFAYFGFADEAIKNYRGLSTGSGLSSTGATSKSPSLPLPPGVPPQPFVFIRKDTTHMRDLFDSFSDMSASYGGTSPLEYEDKEKALILGDDDTRADTRRRARDVAGL